MFCFKCGTSMPDTSEACPQCGTLVSAAPPLPTPAPAAAPAPAQAWQYPAFGQPYAPQPQTEGKAVVSLILGILSLTCLSLLAGIPAIILGHVAQSSIRKSGGRLIGGGMALAGLIMGYISTVIFIPIILAIAIPAFLQERITTNEAAAASSMRIINTAQVEYVTNYPNAGYARSLATLGTGSAGPCHASEEHACLLDQVLGCNSEWCNKNGYNFRVTGVECEQNGVCAGYLVVATPLGTNTGIQSYCSTSDAVIRYQRGGYSLPTTVAECNAWPPTT